MISSKYPVQRMDSIKSASQNVESGFFELLDYEWVNSHTMTGAEDDIAI